jgi:DNA-binding IclR family transcriptional regulator
LPVRTAYPIAPAIPPLFRSENQLAILAELFAGAEEQLGVADLARRAQVNETTALREVHRLVEAGLLSARVR